MPSSSKQLLPAVAEPMSQPPPSLVGSTESVGLNPSGSLPSQSTLSTSRISVQSALKPELKVTTPNMDSKEAFLEFCRQYAPYMQYSALFDREVRTMDGLYGPGKVVLLSRLLL